MIIILAVQSLPGEELGFYFTPEYNRSFNFCWNLSTVSSVTFNELYTVRGGLAMGGAGSKFDMKLYAGADAALPFNFPLYFSMFYNYNGLPGYETHSHSILPLISLKYRAAGISIGNTLRFTRFYGEKPVFEPMFSFSGYVNFIDNDIHKFGLKAANYDDFTYGNFGSYFLGLYYLTRLSEKLRLVNEIEIHQGGSVGLSSNFYGLIYRGGVQFSW